jgi:hypothetical protein
VLTIRARRTIDTNLLSAVENPDRGRQSNRGGEKRKRREEKNTEGVVEDSRIKYDEG